MARETQGWHARVCALEALVADQAEQIAALRAYVEMLQARTLPIRKLGGFTMTPQKSATGQEPFDTGLGQDPRSVGS